MEAAAAVGPGGLSPTGIADRNILGGADWELHLKVAATSQLVWDDPA